jgi:hypothetical protein
MGEHRLFAGGPKPGALPNSMPFTYIHRLVGARWKSWLCECSHVLFPIEFSTCCPACIARVDCFIDELAKRILHKQFKALHVSLQTIISALALVDVMPLQRRWINYQLTPKPKGKRPSSSYSITGDAASSTFSHRRKHGFSSPF